MMPKHSLYIMQGLTPREHEVKIIEKEAQDIYKIIYENITN